MYVFYSKFKSMCKRLWRRFKRKKKLRMVSNMDWFSGGYFNSLEDDWYKDMLDEEENARELAEQNKKSA